MKNFTITELDNGIRIVSENLNYAKSFSLGFWFDVGSRDENEENNGICHFIEHILFKGTKTRRAVDISNEVESFGGEINAFTEKDHTCFYSRGYKTNLEKTFIVFADMLQNSLFDEKDVKNEAKIICDEIKDYDDNPSTMIFENFEELIFEGDPLRFPILGQKRNVKNFTRLDLLKFFNKNYCFNNFVISASGAVEHNLLVRLTKKYIIRDFRISNTKRKFNNNYKSKLITKRKDVNQGYIVIGRPCYGVTDKRRNELILLSTVLGDGCGSRLFQILREEMGLAYQINSSINFFKETSAWGIFLSTHPKNIEKTVNIINTELKKIRETKVDSGELKRAKEYFKGSLFLSMENPTSRMNQVAQSLLYFNKVETIKEIIANIESVKRDEILECANQLLDAPSLTSVIFYPNKK